LAFGTHFFVLYGLDEGNGFGFKRTVSETSGVAGRVREEELDGERGVYNRDDGEARKWAYTFYMQIKYGLIYVP
jgi:hypothetical protein